MIVEYAYACNISLREYHKIIFSTLAKSLKHIQLISWNRTVWCFKAFGNVA